MLIEVKRVSYTKTAVGELCHLSHSMIIVFKPQFHWLYALMECTGMSQCGHIWTPFGMGDAYMKQLSASIAEQKDLKYN